MRQLFYVNDSFSKIILFLCRIDNPQFAQMPLVEEVLPFVCGFTRLLSRGLLSEASRARVHRFHCNVLPLFLFLISAELWTTSVILMFVR